MVLAADGEREHRSPLLVRICNQLVRVVEGEEVELGRRQI